MSSPIRMTGMATGLDTDALIKQLMQAKKMPIDRMKQQQTSLTWQRDSYREMNTLMAQLRDAASSLRLSSSINPKKVTIDNTMVTATASSTANNGVYALTVKQAATAATIVGNAISSATTQLNTGGSTVLTVNGTDVTFNQNSTANDVVTALNANSAQTGVKASFDAVTKRLTLTNTKTGSASAIDIVYKSGDNSLLTNMNLPATTATGKQAIVDYNGATNLAFDSNTFLIEGVNFQLKPSGTATMPVSMNVTIENDADKMFNNIKSFVDKYNEVIDKVYTKTHEQKYRDYKPLTDDQRTSMKADEITLWEEKAKSGLLRSDSTLNGALDTFRDHLANPVSGLPSGVYNMLSDIGITGAPVGDKTSYADHGKLYIDEDKLKTAIQTNPSQVADLFTKGYGDTIYNDANTTINRLTKLAGSSAMTVDNSTLSVSIRDLNDDIYEANKKLSDYEDQYYKQFANLETMMNKMNSQSSWMSQQFASMGSGA